MKRKIFLQSLVMLAASPYVSKAGADLKQPDYIRLLRHATLIIQLNGKKILVDPMLSGKDEMDPVQNCGNDIRIPMVDLPIDTGSLNEILKGIDAVVITHTHRDHWDAAAQKLIDKTKLIFCQPVDAEKIKAQGFTNVNAIEIQAGWEGIMITRTKGKHGTGEMGQKMGEVSGFVFKTKAQSVYVAGDTIWCSDVEDALQTHKPGVTVVNAGGAKFLAGDPITMTPDDVIKTYDHYPKTKVIAVHMDTINHCFAKRSDLLNVVEQRKLTSRITIPTDGELIKL